LLTARLCHPDRKGIEDQTKVWDKTIADHRAELSEWVEVLKSVHKRRIQIITFANNHYAGHGPGTVQTFRDLWREQVSTETSEHSRVMKQGQLFQ
jgi:hypothetical protein